MLLCAAWPATASTAPFRDPLDVPAQESVLAARRLLNGVAAAGGRLVAVGQRGHIVYSDDGGSSWIQARVPVSADLTAVHFASADRGWAVGHGGVILATADGGRSWAKQLDARDLGPMLAASYAGAGDGPGGLRRQVEILTAPGADASFLDVWFADERTGFAVGTFNLVLRTGDGGGHWTPWLHRTPNPEALHLHAVRGVAAGVYVAGERGLLLKLDPGGQRLTPLRVGYAGSLFGVTGQGEAVIAHGLRGHAFRSVDGGVSWREVATGIEATLTGSTALPDGRIVLVSEAGQALVSADQGRSFRAVPLERPWPASAVAAARGDSVVLVGIGGARLVRLR